MKPLKLLPAVLALVLVLTACGGGRQEAENELSICLEWTPNTNHKIGRASCRERV